METKYLKIQYSDAHNKLSAIMPISGNYMEIMDFLKEQNPSVEIAEYTKVKFSEIQIEEITKEQYDVVIGLKLCCLDSIDFIQKGLDGLLSEYVKHMEIYEDQTGIYIWEDNTDDEYRAFIKHCGLKISLEHLKYLIEHGEY